jgi:hypothetical protein
MPILTCAVFDRRAAAAAKFPYSSSSSSDFIAL